MINSEASSVSISELGHANNAEINEFEIQRVQMHQAKTENSEESVTTLSFQKYSEMQESHTKEADIVNISVPIKDLNGIGSEHITE